MLNTIRYLRMLDLPPLRMVRIRDSLQPKTYLDLEFPIRRLQEEQPDALVFLGKVGIGISEFLFQTSPVFFLFTFADFL